MRKTFARKRTMIAAADTIEQARPWAAALVERAERASGSRMAAYERVAGSVGVSGSWLRKLLGRQPGLVLAAHEYLNIARAYEALCERFDAEAEKERAKLAKLRGDVHAALAIDPVVVASAAREDRGGAPSGAPAETVVRSMAGEAEGA